MSHQLLILYKQGRYDWSKKKDCFKKLNIDTGVGLFLILFECFYVGLPSRGVFVMLSSFYTCIPTKLLYYTTEGHKKARRLARTELQETMDIQNIFTNFLC